MVTFGATFVPTAITDTKNRPYSSFNNNTKEYDKEYSITKKPKKYNRRLRGNNKNSKRKDRIKFNKIKKTLTNNIVVNLSKYSLNNSELSILNKGLGFSLAHLKPSYTTIDNDIQRFERLLQLHFHFSTQPSSDNNYQQKPLENTKDWWPKKLNSKITELCDQLKVILHNSYKCKTHLNLQAAEIRALKTLKNNNNIIIIRADKGGAICVIDKDIYMTKIHTMLSDQQVYTKTNTDDTQVIKNKCDEIINRLYHSNFLTYKQLKFLTNYIPQCPRFYGLPKIHKDGCPLRPIVSQINGPTRGLNQILDIYLTVAEKHIPYILRDTTAFLKILDELNINKDTNIFTLDVVSLYTNIPHEEGARWVSDFYEETLPLWNHTSPDITPVDKNIIYEMILLILKNTTFSFDNQFYCQNYGTTMGAIFSVKFANIYMHKWFEHFIPQYTGVKPPFLARLVDDCFGIYDGSKDAFLKFLNFLNNCHPSIKFEYTFSDQQVSFLDTVTYIEDDKIKTKIYIKPTDRKQYLHYDSDHPYHTKHSIPYSQAIRYRRIICDDNEYHKQLSSLKTFFINRHYPPKMVDHQLDRATNLSRTELLTTKPKSNKFLNQDSAFLPLIIPYNNSLINAKLQFQFMGIWNEFLQSDTSIKNIFEDSTPKIVYKRGVTIQQVLNSKHNMTTMTESDKELIHNLASLMDENDDRPCSRPCGSSKCLCCNHMTKTSCYTDSSNNRRFTIKQNFNCSNAEVIYLINCNKCHKYYVGQTKRPFRDRLNNHISDIKLHKKTAIAIHFNLPEHTHDNLNVTIIENTTNLSKVETERLEYNFIKKLNTIYPNGLNNYPITRL